MLPKAERYQIASQSSRISLLQTTIEEGIEKAIFSDDEKQELRGLFQFVKANEPLPRQEDLEKLTFIDAMVQASEISIPLKQLYSIASAQTRAYTVDFIVLNLIQENSFIADRREQYLDVYNQARLGQKVRDEYTLGALDSLVYLSDISLECKAIYKLSRDKFYNQDEAVIEASLQEYFSQGKQTVKLASGFIPNLTSVFGAAGVSAGTGTAISSLSGTAATNATLATLGGGSVADGGLGMLGGLAVAIAPNIPEDKLSNAFYNYASVTSDEIIFAIVDTTIFNNAEEGITFTNKGMWWKKLSKPEYLSYSDSNDLIKIMDLPSVYSEEETESIRKLALALGKDVALTEIKAL